MRLLPGGDSVADREVCNVLRDWSEYWGMTSKLWAVCVMVCVVGGARADEPSLVELEREGIQAMGSGDYQLAEDRFREIADRTPNSYVGAYNLASAHARQGEIEESIAALKDAIKRGFTDKLTLVRDPDLGSIRGTEDYKALIEGWGDVIEVRRNLDLARAAKLMRKKRETRTIDDYRVQVMSAHDPVSTDQSVEELERIARWAEEELFPNLDLVPIEDQHWVTVTLPERVGFTQWATGVFGPGVRGSITSVGGAYEHQQRRLVAQDLGATLRHEFIHVLHWRDMSRMGQNQAAWVQEGLASLVEDYDMVGGALVPVPSWRTNMVKRLLDVRRLPTIRELAGTDLARFTSSRPLAKYAHARTVMMFLLSEGKLKDFYLRYARGFSVDPTGIRALEGAMGMELDEIEAEYRAYVSGLPVVAETGSDLGATIGVGVENGSGDGVVVTELPGGARSRTGLRMGTVITGINGRATRDLHELIRVLSDYEAGEEVRVSTRRGVLHTELSITLIER